MSKQQIDDEDGDDDVTEITSAEFEKVAGVRSPANRTPFILLKSRESDVAFAPVVTKQQKAKPKPVSSFGRNAGTKLSPKARRAFQENAERVKAGKRPKPKKAKVKKTQRVEAWPVMAAKAALSYSQEIPATGCSGEAASIMAAVTGERSSGLCSARTASGTPCMRPAVGGKRCHLHG